MDTSQKIELFNNTDVSESCIKSNGYIVNATKCYQRRNVDVDREDEYPCENDSLLQNRTQTLEGMLHRNGQYQLPFLVVLHSCFSTV
jgi:hypothetical protein